MIDLTTSQINYLYTISILENPTITSVANYLSYSKPSVIKAFTNLEELGLLEYNKKNIKLTNLGIKYAKNYSARRNALIIFLTEVLDVNKNQAVIDADKIMKVVSCSTTASLSQYLRKDLNMEIDGIENICSINYLSN